MDNAASRFGQHLAHTEKKYRDRALKKLTVYLTKKKEWTELEWDKLWKALFYCMWMSDKRPVQEELSTNLAGLVHRIPSAESALEFVHSFFRTMHREWHGLDGLRLDKFYSLDWEEDLVQEFVTILSTEVVSQLPNGLRMHLADLGQGVDYEAFMILLEPFFTLLSSEYDKTVFKRVRELVFEDMLTKYKFGPQSEKEKDDERRRLMTRKRKARCAAPDLRIASADDTAERNRSALYTLYKKFFTITHVDSFQAAQEEAAKPKKIEVKDEEAGEKKNPRNLRNAKLRRKREEGQKQKVAAVVKTEDVEVKNSPAETEKSKTQKNQKKKQELKKQEKPEKSPVKEQLKPKQEKVEKKKESYTTVTKSGKKFKRCSSCGGYGKGLKTQKKKAASASKKRKAEFQAQAAREEQEKAESNKKVTFGKSKALRHEVSVKRLKASAKRDAVAKDSEEIKSVLKVTTPSPVATKKSKKTKGKGRKTAADFM
ncbi:Nucleolar, Nop52 [Phytophthora cactorum]|nr:Nucleolar, Nop52 [Phytophthora cactorum]